MEKNKDHTIFRLVLILCFIFGISHPLKLYPQSYKFDHLSLKDGLSQITVNCIYQDSKGFLWFGTQDGLNLYDGYNFKHFKSDPNNNNSLSHSWIWDIYEDNQNNLWVATWNGLNKLSPNRTNFKKYFPDSYKKGSIRGNRPVSIAEDSSGRIWIGTWGGGLNIYHPESDSFSCVSKQISKNKDMPGDYIRKIFLDSNENLWIGTWAGLWRINTKENFPFHIEYIELLKNTAPSELKILSINENSHSEIWIGTLGKGLFQITQDLLVKRNYIKKDNPSKGLSSNDINSIYIDQYNKIWAGNVSKGITIIDVKADNFTHLINDPEDQESLGGNNINCMQSDKSGLLWIGTGGLSIFNPSQQKFNHNHDLLSNSKINYNTQEISALYQDKTKKIWVGTSGNGISLLSGASEMTSKDQSLAKQLKNSSNYNIGAFTEDIDGDIWVATRGNGLLHYSSSENRFLPILKNPEEPELPDINYINGLTYIPPSTLWLATYDHGLIAYDFKQNNYQTFRHEKENTNSFPANYLLRIFKDSKEELWICSWGGGIIRFNPKNYSFRSYQNQTDDPESICDNISQTVLEVQKNGSRKIWIGTRNGLSCLDLTNEKNDRFKNYFQSDGLPGNVINAILCDKNNDLWISTNSGLCKFNPDSMIFKNYEENDGLQSNEFNAGVALQLKDSRLMFGGVHGFNVFYPDSIKESDFKPDIAITSFKIFNEEIAINPNEQKIILNYNQNFFSFEFSSLDYSHSKKNQYKYQMSEIDKEWVLAENRRYASYTNINPGHYTFKVMGSNSDGIWSNKKAEFQLEITPPYWQKLWFRILIILIFFSFIYLFYANRIRKIKEIERLRVRIASDLHDDIGSALTRITIHSQQIQGSKDKKKVSNSIQKIGELSREIISTMSDIVWSIDARNDNLIDMLDHMRNFAYNTLSERDISVNFKHEGMEKHKKINVLLRQNIFSIFKESVNNIVKHSQTNEVFIYLINSEKEFVMKIQDKGVGFDNETARKGNGINNMKMRASRINAEMRIINFEGTTVLLKCKSL